MIDNEIKILELFGGIGACTKAFERLGIPHKVVDYVELDDAAVSSYNAIHQTDFKPQDITKWDKDLEVDFIMHGSPCTDFSIAGTQLGGDEGSGTRSSLMYETLRIVDKLRPKYVLWENVKNLLSDKHVHNYDNYVNKMQQMGYSSFAKVLNARDYDIPQNRERIFTLSVLGDSDFQFPVGHKLDIKVQNLLEHDVPEKYYLSSKQISGMRSYMTDIINSNTIKYKNNLVELPCIVASRGRDLMNPSLRESTNNYMQTIEINIGGVSNTLTTFQKDNYVMETKKTKLCNDLVASQIVTGGEIINHSYTSSKQRPYLSDFIESTDGVVPTLTTRPDIMGYVEQLPDGLRIRKLTPLECWRLMGFDDEDFYKAAKGKTDAQLYKQAGNSIVVNVLEAILRMLFHMERDYEKVPRYKSLW